MGPSAEEQRSDRAERSGYSLSAPPLTRWSGRGMPAGICPQLAADRGIGDQKADGVGDLLGSDETAQLGVRQDMLVDVLLTQGANHRRIGETGVNDAAAHTVKNRLLRERGGRPFQS